MKGSICFMMAVCGTGNPPNSVVVLHITSSIAGTLHSFAAASTSTSTVVSNNVANASEPHSTNEVDVVAQMSIDQNK